MRYLFCILFAGSLHVGFGQSTRITECVIDNGELKSVSVDYDPATGNRSIVVNGAKKDFYSVYPKEGTSYAAKATWYINSERISFNALPYVKYGLPRVLGTTEIEKTGAYKGINIYREAGTKGTPEVIYIPARQGCEFQPYQLDCQSLFMIKGPAFYTTGKTIKLTAKKANGSIKKGKHHWEVEGATITSGQGTPTITISTKAVTEGTLRVSVKVDANELCTWTTHEVYLKKEGQARE